MDDLIFAGSKDLRKMASIIATCFPSKPASDLPFPFLGCDVKHKISGVFLSQPSYSTSLRPLPPSALFDAVRRLRHQLAWLSSTRPDIPASVNIAAQVTVSTFKLAHVTKLNKAVQQAQDQFSTNEYGSSQLAFIILIVDGNGKASIISFATKKIEARGQVCIGSRDVRLRRRR